MRKYRKMEVEIQAAVSALGYIEGNQYCKEPDCLGTSLTIKSHILSIHRIPLLISENLRDLIKFLQNDRRETCQIRRWLIKSGLIENDLIPILSNFHENPPIFDAALR